MKTSEIEKSARERLNISELNDMQRQMGSTPCRKIILTAPTGSGKTLAFSIRLLREIHADGGLQAVVMAPSRELVLQSAGVLSKVASGLRVIALYGGHSMEDERNSLKTAATIIVATPGRLLDHVNRGNLVIDDAAAVVLDEYDKILEAGFEDEMRRLLKRMKRTGLRMLTSATALEALPEYFGNIADFEQFDFTADTASPRELTEIVEIPSAAADKLETLKDLLHSIDNQKVIIFANHRESAERIFESLKKAGFPVGLYHGGLEQERRRQAVQLLENETTPVLVATDIAARGLDISDVGTVVHYHLPVNAETWTHRNGRTARMGAKGTVYVIVNEKDSLPEFIDFDRKLYPKGTSANPLRSTMATLYFNAGKREKISRGDIAGYLMQKGGLTRDEVGKIDVADHYAIAAVARDKAKEVVSNLAPHKLKNKRVKVSLLNSSQ